MLVRPVRLDLIVTGVPQIIFPAQEALSRNVKAMKPTALLGAAGFCVGFSTAFHRDRLQPLLCLGDQLVQNRIYVLKRDTVLTLFVRDIVDHLFYHDVSKPGFSAFTDG